MIRALLVAMQFLTALPIHLEPAPGDREIGRSFSYYPLVGLLLGGVLAGGGRLLAGADPMLAAALLVLVWTALTGALHLDGLADCADAWVGGRGDRERTLAIMKDPYCGPMGVAAVVVALLLKFATLTVLCQHKAFILLAVAPVVGRAAVQLLFLTTPYVRPAGLGAALAEHMRRGEVFLVLIIACAGVVFAAAYAGLRALIGAGGVFLLFRRSMLIHIGGTTGDTAGALVEISEATVLTAICLASHF